MNDVKMKQQLDVEVSSFTCYIHGYCFLVQRGGN